MFIERSAGRIRLARTLFVLGGLVPFAVLAAWAGFRNSAGHVASLCREAEQVLGVPLEIGSVEHLRPNCLRLRACRILSPSGDAMLAVPVVDVESSSAEVRLRLPEVDCTPSAARTLVAIVGGWLRQPVRHGRSWVVDVVDFRWQPATASAEDGDAASGRPASGLHVECVAAGDARAVRVRREPQSADEWRVRSRVAAGADTQRLEVSGTVADPLPAAVAAALVGSSWGRCLESLGGEAVVRGGVEAVCDRGQWSGSFRGVVEQVDLATCTAGLPHRLSGTATLSLPRCEWQAGRLEDCRLECDAIQGHLGQTTLDALVSALGCRPGPAHRSLAREEIRGFDSLSFCLEVDARGMLLRAGPGRGGSLLGRHGLSLLEEPVGMVSMSRLAWFLSPSESMAVPASDASAWLLSVLPSRGVGIGRTGGPREIGGGELRSQPAQAERPVPRSGF